jgi:hypothetical protein
MSIAEIEHKMMMDAIGLAAHLLTPNATKMANLIEAERSMHSFMHITDPTMYIKAMNSKSLQQQVDLAKAALAFVLAVQNVKSQIAEVQK